MAGGPPFDLIWLHQPPVQRLTIHCAQPPADVRLPSSIVLQKLAYLANTTLNPLRRTRDMPEQYSIASVSGIASIVIIGVFNTILIYI